MARLEMILVNMEARKGGVMELGGRDEDQLTNWDTDNYMTGFI